MRFITSLFLTLLAVTAAAQTSDFYFNPNYARPEGGTEVRIDRTASQVQFHAPQVFFGDVPSPRVTLLSATTIIAVAPPHAVGIVLVTVRDNFVVYSSPAKFAFSPDVEQILIPIAFKSPIDAGYGTRWVSEIAVYNDSDDAVPLDPEICFSIGTPFDCRASVKRVPPHTTMRVEPWSQSADYPALLLRPPADRAGKLHFTARLRETSRDADGPGTEIPIVRSRDFEETRVLLSSVPVNLHFRSTLRVYTRDWEIVLRVKDDATGELLKTLLLRRSFPTDGDPFGTVILPGLLETAEVASHAKVRIEVEASSPVWTMLTLTDNESQRVQIFTPH